MRFYRLIAAYITQYFLQEEKEFKKIRTSRAFGRSKKNKSDAFKKILSNINGKIRLLNSLRDKLRYVAANDSENFVHIYQKIKDEHIPTSPKYALEILILVLLRKKDFGDGIWNTVFYIDDYYNVCYVSAVMKKENWYYDAGKVKLTIFNKSFRAIYLCKTK